MKINYDKIKENVSCATVKVYTFGKKHGKKIAIAVGGVIVFVGTLALFKTIFKGKGGIVDDAALVDLMGDSKVHTPMQPFSQGIGENYAKEVDDAIFTDLAPEIEEACIRPGIDRFQTERFFDIGDRICKHITVTIENIVGD